MTDEPNRRTPCEPPIGRYANQFRIGCNKDELFIEFYQCYGNDSEPILHTRIITSSSYGKVLLETLRKSLDEFEE